MTLAEHVLDLNGDELSWFQQLTPQLPNRIRFLDVFHVIRATSEERVGASFGIQLPIGWCLSFLRTQLESFASSNYSPLLRNFTSILE